MTVFSGARNYDDPGLPPLQHPERLAQCIAAPRPRRSWWRFVRIWRHVAIWAMPQGSHMRSL
jgi:hypothetical protein